jgi:RimJ/RimL family protein N-acetyltransferase
MNQLELEYKNPYDILVKPLREGMIIGQYGIRLRPLTKEDAPFVTRLFSVPEVTKFMNAPKDIPAWMDTVFADPLQVRLMVELLPKATLYRPCLNGQFESRTIPDLTQVGMISVRSINPDARSAIFGNAYEPEYQGWRVGTMAGIYLLETLRGLGYNSVEAECYSENTVSIKMLEAMFGPPVRTTETSRGPNDHFEINLEPWDYRISYERAGYSVGADEYSRPDSSYDSHGWSHGLHPTPVKKI